MTLTDKTTVEELEDGGLIIVGEEHTPPGALYSQALGERVLDEYQPGTVAIEMPPGRITGSSGAMGLAREYAKRNGTRLLTIDNQRHLMHRVVDPTQSLMRAANQFTHPIREDGDLNENAIWNARQAVHELFGDDAFYEMYTHREENMAARLREAMRRFPQPIVLFCGAFHVPSLVEQYEQGDDTLPLAGKRVTAFVSDPAKAKA